MKPALTFDFILALQRRGTVDVNPTHHFNVKGVKEHALTQTYSPPEFGRKAYTDYEIMCRVRQPVPHPSRLVAHNSLSSARSDQHPRFPSPILLGPPPLFGF